MKEELRFISLKAEDARALAEYHVRCLLSGPGCMSQSVCIIYETVDSRDAGREYVTYVERKVPWFRSGRVNTGNKQRQPNMPTSRIMAAVLILGHLKPPLHG